MTEPQHTMFPKIPRSNPKWSTGIISLIVSVAAAITSFYVVVRPEVTKYMESQAESTKANLDLQKSTTESAMGIQAQMVSALLASVQLNTSQINNLQNQLTITIDENKKLKDRVSIIEKDLSDSQVSLEDCLNKLNQHKGK